MTKSSFRLTKMKSVLAVFFGLAVTCLHAQIPDYVPSNGLVGWYPFDGNADDESGNENHGVVNGAMLTEDRFGQENVAYSFDGINDYIEVAHDDMLNSMPMSASFWTRSTDIYDAVFLKKYNAPSWNGWTIEVPFNESLDLECAYYISVCGGIYQTYCSPVPFITDSISNLIDGSWHHLVFVVDADGGKVFMDGVMIHQQAWYEGSVPNNEIAASHSSQQPLRFGGHVHNGQIEKPLNGDLDDIGLWNRALTQDEILGLYNASLPVPGCTDPEACNYSAIADLDDESCQYPLIPGDCDAGSVACADGTYWNSLIQQCLPISCPTCPGDVDEDYAVGVSDLLFILSAFGDNCPETGCTDSQATNYDPNVVINDGSCVYPPCLDAQEPGADCDDGDSNTFNTFWNEDGCLCEGSEYVAEDGSGPCEGVGTVTYHGYDYQLVEIGGQCWFQENLRATLYSNGDTVLTGLNQTEWIETNSGAACSYADDEGNIEEFGLLYNFYAASDERSLCPSGWMVAGHSDWISLEIGLGLDSISATSEGYRGADITLAEMLLESELNSSGFSAKFGGRRVGSTGEFTDLGFHSAFFTSTPLNEYHGWFRLLSETTSWVYSGYSAPNGNNRGYSVRCIKSEADTCFDPDSDGVCPEDEISGCTDETACNFNAEATHDDESCIPNQEAGSSCDDGDDNTFNDAWDAETCTCAGTPAVAEDGSGPCEGALTVNYHGYDYQLVEIGGQCWFRENLRAQSYANGDSIPSGLNNSEWSTTTSGASAVNGENGSNLETYGRLYNWYAVEDARGLCPNGWHVPTDGEWMTLEMALGMSESEANGTGWRGTDQGAQMKLNSGWSNNGNGTNSSGFSLLPGGLRYMSGVFGNPGVGGAWWSSSLVGSNAWIRHFSIANENVNRYNDFRRVGWSVRCIKSEADTCFDPDSDGVCPEDEISGCSDQTACNYNPEATHDDDGSCTYQFSPCCDCDGNDIQDTDSDGVCQCMQNEILGCQDDAACNYNPEATDEDGSCTYPGVQECSGCPLDCDGNLLNDADGDGICDTSSCAGCTDESALNYDPMAVDDDGSCVY